MKENNEYISIWDKNALINNVIWDPCKEKKGLILNIASSHCLFMLGKILKRYRMHYYLALPPLSLSLLSQTKELAQLLFFSPFSVFHLLFFPFNIFLLFSYLPNTF